MEKIAVLASSNAHKLEEIQEILKDFDYTLVPMSNVGLGDMEIIENGATFEENSLIKARAVQNITGGIVIADDSGLEVDYLGGRPGVRSARYAGEPTNYEKNNIKLLEELDGIEYNERTARFVTVITMLFEDGICLVARGEVEGIILDELRGNNGFGYDPLFYVPMIGKTFAECTSEEKNDLSHRANALKKLSKMLSDKA